MAFTKVAPAGIGSTPGDGYRIGDSFLHSTGVEITNINATGILTAASLDISGGIDFDGHTELDNLNVAGVSTFNDDVNVVQGKKINFGNTNGTQGHIYFDGSTTRLQTNHGLNIGSPVCVFKSANLAETMVEAVHNAAVKLWFDSSTYSTPKFQTTATGVTIDGTAVAGALDISGDIDVDGHTNLDNVSIAGVSTFSGDITIADKIIHTGDTDTAIRFPAADTIRFEVGNQQAVHILPASAGSGGARMGLGTNSPTGMLHIYGSNPPFRIQNSNDSANLQMGMWDASNVMLQASHRPFKLATETSHPIVFHTGGLNNERLRIDSSGRILKGLTTARGNYGNNTSGVEYGFQIEGTSAILAGLSIVRNSNDANDGGIVLGKTRATSNGGNTVVQAGDDLGNLTFAGNDGSTMLFGAEIFAEVQSGVGNDDMPADLIFKTNGGSTSTTERLRITSGGNIGIGEDDHDGNKLLIRAASTVGTT